MVLRGVVVVVVVVVTVVVVGGSVVAGGAPIVVGSGVGAGVAGVSAPLPPHPAATIKLATTTSGTRLGLLMTPASSLANRGAADPSRTALTGRGTVGP